MKSFMALRNTVAGTLQPSPSRGFSRAGAEESWSGPAPLAVPKVSTFIWRPARPPPGRSSDRHRRAASRVGNHREHGCAACRRRRENSTRRGNNTNLTRLETRHNAPPHGGTVRGPGRPQGGLQRHAPGFSAGFEGRNGIAESAVHIFIALYVRFQRGSCILRRSGAFTVNREPALREGLR
jgi:hypothetical protein